ncbi:MAG: hypothetical protein MJ230_02575 [bacterium]|mgnify:CR=1 FL=1|nr:hypothetical protein [bacterium]
MHDKKQFEQLMLQYNQLRVGADDILQMINDENFDDAISMIKSREAIFLNCKCMRKYLELTPSQEQQVNEIVDEIRKLELRNIETLKKNMNEVKQNLNEIQKTEKIQVAYELKNDELFGSIVNIKE